MNGVPHWEDQYSVIGRGSADALSFLAQNEFDETDIQLADCLWRLMEALDFASTSNNTVGHSSRLEVHIQGEPEASDIAEDFFKLLKSKIRLTSTVPVGNHLDFLDKSKVETHIP